MYRQTITMGDTTTAAIDSGAPYCGTSEDVFGEAPTGIWYKFFSSGGTTSVSMDSATVSTCFNTEFDTQINVYTGSCNGLVCVTGGDQTETCGNGDQTELSFITDPDTWYFVLVHGYADDKGGEGVSSRVGAGVAGDPHFKVRNLSLLSFFFHSDEVAASNWEITPFHSHV